jgi:hypothetical protein
MASTMLRFTGTLLLFPALACAQYSPAPRAYSLTEYNSMFGMPMTRQIARNGQKVFIDQTMPPGSPGSQGIHMRTLYDLDRHTSFTWDLLEPSRPCDSPTVFDGDGNWGDPFESSASMRQQMLGGAKKVGPAALNGIAAELYSVTAPQGTAKIWIEPKYGLMVKVEMAMAGGPAQTRYELKSFSDAPPAASNFVLPPACASGLNKPLPKTGSQVKAGVTGGRSAEFIDVFNDPPDTAAMNRSCNVYLRVVKEGSLEPVKTGFQVAVVTEIVDQRQPNVHVDVGADGRARFSGHEVTNQLRDGVLRIPNVPKDLWLYIHMINAAGGGEALFQRQCIHPEQVLLVTAPAGQNKPGEPPLQSHYLWVKSGPLATVPGAGPAASVRRPAAAAGPKTNVTAVKLRLEPPSYTGPCPSPIQMIAEITADGPGTVWYSFLAGVVAKNGPAEGTVTFHAAGTKTVTLGGTVRGTPPVPNARLLAAIQDEQGRHGPQTARADAPYNRVCQAK